MRKLCVVAAISVAGLGCVSSSGLAPSAEWARVEGLHIPRSTGPYLLLRSEEYPYPNEELGTAMTYSVPDSLPQRYPPFDVFVYPVRRDIAAEAAAARSEIRFMDRTTVGFESTVGQTDTLYATHAGNPILLTPITGSADTIAIRGFLYLTQVRNRYLKIRVTYNAGTSADIDRSMHRRVERLVDDIARRNAE